MPYTKRYAIHDGKKGLSSCINYCMNENKTDGGLLAKGVNCSVNYAVREFMANIEKYHTENTERVAYHTIQSFDYRDNVTPEKVNEIGVKLCKELYPEYQCLVCTHVDKGHLHNHIIINATSLTGRKLDDRLSNSIEGLYGLRACSDRISKAYGCRVMEDFKPIGRYKTKKNYLFETAHIAWKSIITEKIEELKENCQSFDELLERLSLEGYIIKNGKYVSVKPYGKDRFTKLKTLGSDYSESALKKFFLEKQRSDKIIFKDYEILNQNSELLSETDRIAKLSAEAIQLSTNGLKKNKEYPKYFNSRYMELKRYNALVKSIGIMNDEKIYTYEDLVDKIKDVEQQLEIKEIEYHKTKSLNNTMQAQLPIANMYIKYYTAYRAYEEQAMLVGENGLKEPDEVKMFLDARMQMNDADIEEVKEFAAECTKIKIEANKQYAYISFLNKRLDDLEGIRMKHLEQNGYIKGMLFSSSMIDQQRSDDQNYCVRLPYTDYYVYLPKVSVAWKTHGERAYMYLLDDEEYTLYDSKDNEVDKISGDDLETLSKAEKEKIQDYYRSIR